MRFVQQTVEKIDRDGRVLAWYPSLVSAAKANFLSVGAVYHRCAGTLKKDPFALAGASFRYAQEEAQTHEAEKM